MVNNVKSIVFERIVFSNLEQFESISGKSLCDIVGHTSMTVEDWRGEQFLRELNPLVLDMMVVNGSTSFRIEQWMVKDG